MKIELKKIGCSDSPSKFFIMLDSLAYALRGGLREFTGEGVHNLKVELASWTRDAGGAL